MLAKIEPIAVDKFWHVPTIDAATPDILGTGSSATAVAFATTKPFPNIKRHTQLHNQKKFSLLNHAIRVN